MKPNRKFVILLEILVITFLVMSVVPVCGLSDSSADIYAYPNIVNPGDEITVAFSGAPGFELDWIAMYKVGDPNEEEYDVGYYLAGEKSGTLFFTAPYEPGDYEFRLFEDDGYTDIARSNIVTVQEGTTVSTPTPTPTTPSGVHRLGDNTLSDWEVPKPEGTEYTTTFRLTAVPASADLTLDVFQIDHNDPVLVNGNSVGILCKNPIKSWKPCTIKVPGSALRVGSNTLTIQSESRGGNYDDFMIRNIEVTPSSDAKPTPTPIDGEDTQWASDATASSEYSSTGWSAKQTTGAPNTATCGDIRTAWAPKSSGSDPEWLKLTFDTPVHATKLRVHETYNSGFIYRVDLVDINGGTHAIWEGSDTTSCPGWFEIIFSQTTYLVRGVILHTRINGWEEIDAVQLVAGAEEVTPMPSPTPAPASTVESDFNDGPAQNWIDDGSGCWSISDGVYAMTGNKKGDANRYSHYNQEFCGVSYQADVRKIAGDSNDRLSAYGLWIRSDGTKNNHYMFAIVVDGRYMIAKRVGGEFTEMIDMTTSDALKTGYNEWNTLKVVAQGSILQFYANGVLLETKKDTSLSCGKVGLFAIDSADSDSSDTVQFDNVVIIY